MRDRMEAVLEFERVAKALIPLDVPNDSFPIKFFRKILGREKHGSEPPKELRFVIGHKSTFSKKTLEAMGFKVIGCLGFVTRGRLAEFGLSLLADVYEVISCHLLILSGTLIGIKDIKLQRDLERTRNS